MLTKTAPVLVSADGKPVDAFYLKLAREGTLVVVGLPLGAVEAPKPPQP